METLWRRFGVGLLLALSLAGPAAANEPEAGAPLLVADPAVRRGALPNGLRYLVMPNATPQKALSIRLVMDVGSMDEAESERGAAHFVEHMAFRGSRRFPEGRLEQAFAAMGAAAGRDQNAVTSLRTTIYQLDLPDGDEGARARAWSWLRDVADGLLFEPAAVERERGVVLAERDVRTDPAYLAQMKVDAFRRPNLRSSQSAPIGELAVLQTITADQLRAFHARWYRPEHARLVVVGDPRIVAAAEAEIAAAFGDWSPATARPDQKPLRQPDIARGLDAYSLVEPRVSGGVKVCRLRQADPPTGADPALYRQQVARQVALLALHERLDQLRLTNPAIIDAAIDVQLGEGEYRQLCVAARAAPDDWRAAIGALEMEVRRFSTDGLSDDELYEALADFRGGYLGDVVQAGTRQTSALAEQIVLTELTGEVTQAPRQALRAHNLAVEGLTREAVRDAWRSDWRGAGPLISVVGATVPTPSEVLAAWASEAARPVQPFVKREVPVWAYGSLGAPGVVVKREVLADPGLVRLRFANGVVLNFKQTAYAKGRVEVRAEVGDGREALGDWTLDQGRLATDSFILGGLGRHPYSDLKAMFGAENMSIDFALDDHAFTLSVSAFRERLPIQLQLMAAYLTDPGFHDEFDAKLPAEIAANDWSVRSSPAGLIVRRIDEIAGVRPASSATKAAMRSRDFGAWLRPIVTRSPIEITLVGDIDEAAAVELVASNFGVLPARAAQPRGGSSNSFGRFPDSPPARISLTHAGPPDRAMVAMVWPLFVVTPERLREVGALSLLSAVFDDQLRRLVREQLGKTYSPSVYISAAERADQSYLIASAETAPADVAVVEAAMRDLAASLVQERIDMAAFEAARKPMLAQSTANLANNEMWAAYLQGSTRRPQMLLELSKYPRDLADISLGETQQGARDWLGRTPIILIATPEPKT